MSNFLHTFKKQGAKCHCGETGFKPVFPESKLFSMQARQNASRTNFKSENKFVDGQQQQAWPFRYLFRNDETHIQRPLI